MNHIMKSHRMEFIVHSGAAEKMREAVKRLISTLGISYEGF